MLVRLPREGSRGRDDRVAVGRRTRSSSVVTGVVEERKRNGFCSRERTRKERDVFLFEFSSGKIRV